MNKILTVSVAAYNVERYLENTLTSLAIEEIIDDIEVFVIDDGGNDSSIDIARRFHERFPDSFFAVHKENGGYGSTVAYSIEHATGRYFKLLDGDDWFDGDGLRKVIERLKTSNEDVVITDYYMGPDPEHLEIIPCHQSNETIIDVKDYSSKYTHGMWSLFYRTDLLKRSNLKFPLHTLYTDQIYAIIPFAYAHDILFVPLPVYCYRFGRDEQSTSRVSRVKHASDMFKVCEILYDFYDEYKSTNENPKEYVLKRISRYYVNAIRTFLLMPVNRETKKRLIEYECGNKTNHPDVYYAAEKSNDMGILIRVMRRTGYLAYWATKLIPENKMNF